MTVLQYCRFWVHSFSTHTKGYTVYSVSDYSPIFQNTTVVCIIQIFVTVGNQIYQQMNWFHGQMKLFGMLKEWLKKDITQRIADSKFVSKFGRGRTRTEPSQGSLLHRHSWCLHSLLCWKDFTRISRIPVDIIVSKPRAIWPPSCHTKAMYIFFTKL